MKKNRRWLPLIIGWLAVLMLVLACRGTVASPMPTAGTPFPIFPTATRRSGTPTPNPLVQPPYQACHAQRRSPFDFTLFPADHCADEMCVDTGMETAVYTAWKAEMMQAHQLDEAGFNEHIQLANVSIMTSGERVMVVIDYVVINDWARTYQSDIVSLTAEPDAAMLAEAAHQAVFAETQITLPQTASTETIAASFAACDPALEINWCYLDYPNFGGRLYATAFRVLDLEADKCLEAAVYVDTGELWYCRERPCMIDE